VSVPDESYFRNASYALNLISTFLLLPLGRYLCWWTTGTCFIQKIYAPPPLPYFKVNICPFQSPSPLRLNIFRLFAYSLTKLYRYTPEIFLFSTATFKYTPSEELDKNIQRTSLGLLFSNWNEYSHFRSGLNWFWKFKKRCFKNQMSVIWSWTYFYNLHWNNYLYFKGLLYISEEMLMTMALLHMASLENSECIWKIQRKPEVSVSVSMTEK
jgi:hypothetical protein